MGFRDLHIQVNRCYTHFLLYSNYICINIEVRWASLFLPENPGKGRLNNISNMSNWFLLYNI